MKSSVVMINIALCTVFAAFVFALVSFVRSKSSVKTQNSTPYPTMTPTMAPTATPTMTPTMTPTTSGPA
jgi:flagellar basal body-associated protein FliL